MMITDIGILQVNSEYYTGWLDYWGQKWNYVPTTTVIKTMRDMLDMGASVNLYVVMFVESLSLSLSHTCDVIQNVFR